MFDGIAARLLGPAGALALLAGCATTPAEEPTRAGPAPQATVASGDPQAPMRDLTLFPKEVSPLLIEALDYPYAPPAPRDCATVAARVQALDAALGADLDDPRRPPRNDRTAARLLVSGVKSAIPYFGWLRRLTGADRRQRLAEAAFTAGYARRGYLKGVGEQLGCRQPAAPMPVPVEDKVGATKD